jgi:hypothetical protein
LDLDFKDRATRENITELLKHLEPRRYIVGEDKIQEQNQEVDDVIFIMSGKVGVGYRLFNQVFYGLSLHRRQVINDHCMIHEKVSEFSYIPIVETVNAMALRK